MNQETLRFYIERICNQTAWPSWQKLEGSWLGDQIPRTSGIYALRLKDAPDWLYVGETGRKEETLKSRIGALREVFHEEQMPYRSPHTAGPHLWALRQTTKIPFEVSIISLGPPKKARREKDKKDTGKTLEAFTQPEAPEWLQEEVEEPVRKGLEALAIALHRQQFGRIPAAQNGRMLAGWRSSSSNTTELAVRGQRYRGYPTPLKDESHVPGIPPIAALSRAGDPISLQWGGHAWSAWCPPALAQPPADAAGLYRLRHPDAQELLYIGRGQLADRLKDYRRGNFECSWVRGDWLYHQQLELLTDLLASYLLSCLSLPPAQFGESKQDRLIRMGQPIAPERAWWSVMLPNLSGSWLPTAS